MGREREKEKVREIGRRFKERGREEVTEKEWAK